MAVRVSYAFDSPGRRLSSNEMVEYATAQEAIDRVRERFPKSMLFQQDPGVATAVEWVEAWETTEPTVFAVISLPAHYRVPDVGNCAWTGGFLQPEVDDRGALTVKSPAMGRFYGNLNPDAPPYVAVSMRLRPISLLGFIESMAVFVPLCVEIDAIVEEVLVGDGDVVDCGRPLFSLTVLPKD